MEICLVILLTGPIFCMEIYLVILLTFLYGDLSSNFVNYRSTAMVAAFCMEIYLVILLLTFLYGDLSSNFVNYSVVQYSNGGRPHHHRPEMRLRR